MRAENRKQMMDKLGAVQNNDRNSWCAVNEDEQTVYFSLWVDKSMVHDGHKGYVLQEPWWGEDRTQRGANTDLTNKISLVMDRGYTPRGYIIVAEDTTAMPRKIASIRTTFYYELDRLVKLEDGTVFAQTGMRVDI